jgi:hypothetical protein
MIALWLLVQAPLPAVGDTIWLERRVQAAPGEEVRAAPWPLSNDVELLGRPVILRQGETVIVRYPAVAWSPGIHEVPVPGPVVVRSDGRTDSLPSEPVRVEVRSLLPPDVPDSAIPIQPEAAPVLRPETSIVPPAIAVAVGAVLLLLGYRWWRRRGRALTAPAPGQTVRVAPVEEWVAAGEARSVASAAVEELRHMIARAVPDAHPGLDLERCLAVVARRRPSWPQGEIAEVLRSLDAARFGPVSGADAEDLYARAMQLGSRLGGAR